MKQLTENEIYRTAFKYKDWKLQSPFGYVLPNKDHNEMCPYCKNEYTDVVRDKAYLQPFAEAFTKVGVSNFTVVYCDMCEAVFSFYKEEK